MTEHKSTSRYVKNAKQRGARKSRRQFLDLIRRSGVSAAVLKASPLAFSIFSSRYAQAREGGNKHAVFMFIGDGSPPNHWLPSSATQMATATVPYGNQGVPGIEAYDVANYCHFHEVSNSWGSHGQTFKCMGNGGIDAWQYINTLDTSLAVSNTWPTRFPIVRVGVNMAESGFSVEDGQVATFKKGAKILYDDLFSGISVEEGNNTYSKAFEMNAKAIESIKAKLGVDERARMDKHLETMRKIEDNLKSMSDNGGGNTCATPSNISNDADVVKQGKLVSDILIAAFKCDLVSIASVSLSDDQCKWTIDPAIRPQLNLPVGTPQDFHAAMHSREQSTLKGLGTFLSYISQVPAYFISQLVKETDSMGMPLIDSTLLCQITDMGNGSDHGPEDAPWVLAGPAKFGLGSFANSGYTTNTQLLQSIPGRMELDGKLFG